MGKSSNQKEAEAMQLQTQRMAQQTAAQEAELRRMVYAQIAPFGRLLLDFGIDPVKFLQSPQGAALLAPVRQDIGNNFDQARMNLVDAMAGSGFSGGSGQSVGPMANLFSSEAMAQSGALQNLIGQSLNLGLQGSNVLQGQQAIFNPNASLGNSINAGQSVITAPPSPFMSTILPAIIGAAGTAAGGALGRPPSCWVAAELYGSWTAARVVKIRAWLQISKNPFVRAFAWLYLRVGKQWAEIIKTHRIARLFTKFLFDRFPVGV